MPVCVFVCVYVCVCEDMLSDYTLTLRGGAVLMETKVTISPQVELVGVNKPFRLFLCLETVSIKFNSFKIQKKTPLRASTISVTGIIITALDL